MSRQALAYERERERERGREMEGYQPDGKERKMLADVYTHAAVIAAAAVASLFSFPNVFLSRLLSLLLSQSWPLFVTLILSFNALSRTLFATTTFFLLSLLACHITYVPSLDSPTRSLSLFLFFLYNFLAHTVHTYT